MISVLATYCTYLCLLSLLNQLVQLKAQMGLVNEKHIMEDQEMCRICVSLTNSSCFLNDFHAVTQPMPLPCIVQAWEQAGLDG